MTLGHPIRDVAELERLLQAERAARLENFQNLQHDFDAQQKVLTQLSDQVLSLQRVPPPRELPSKDVEIERLRSRVAALEAVVGAQPQVSAVEEALAKLTERVDLQEKQQEVQQKELCESVAEVHLMRATLAGPLQGGDETRSEDMSVNNAAAEAASAATSNIAELLTVTAELARVLDVERDARNQKIAELDKRLSQGIDECLNAGDAQTLFEAWEKSGVDKYGRVSMEMAEMWDIVEAWQKESGDRLDRVELQLFRETSTPRLTPRSTRRAHSVYSSSVMSTPRTNLARASPRHQSKFNISECSVSSPVSDGGEEGAASWPSGMMKLKLPERGEQVPPGMYHDEILSARVDKQSECSGAIFRNPEDDRSGGLSGVAHSADTKVGTADEGVRLTSKDLDISHKHQTETVSCHDAAAVDCSRDCQLDELDVSCRHTELSMTFDGTASVEEGKPSELDELDAACRHAALSMTFDGTTSVEEGKPSELDELDAACRHAALSMTFDGTTSVEEGKPCELDVSCRLEEFEQAAPVADPVATCLDHSLDSEATTVSTASEELQGIERLQLACG
eukprot:TRINITY_DN6133_c0_g1_i4.p1 TRINITY_DN6133_c0_g1~~TRINITY_DN6133_c0_g1_i4.p1  ORF type:complete len:567 (-),score=137.49 TRINITY_DN6133_c0_g1_i4:212-1912(-)